MPKLRVAVIGCGAIAQMMHLPHLLRLHDRFEVTAVCDISPSLAGSVAEQFRVPRWVTDYRDLLETDIDAALVLNGGSHGQICLDLARAGKHVFVEKPLCYTLSEGLAVQKALQESGSQMMIGYMKRFDPGYGFAHRAIAAAPPPRYVQVTVLHPAQEPYMVHHRLLRAQDLPDGLMEELREQQRALARQELGEAPEYMLDVYTNLLMGSLIHDINATRHLVGEPVEVLSAQVWSEGKGVSANLRFAAGFVGHYSWVYLHDVRHYSEEIGVYGDTQRVTLHFPSPYLRNAPTPVVVEQMDGEAHVSSHVLVNYEEAFEQELVHFHECLTSGATPITPLADGMQDLLALRAIARAALTGQPQPIPAFGGESR